MFASSVARKTHEQTVVTRRPKNMERLLLQDRGYISHAPPMVFSLHDLHAPSSHEFRRALTLLLERVVLLRLRSSRSDREVLHVVFEVLLLLLVVTPRDRTRSFSNGRGV